MGKRSSDSVSLGTPLGRETRLPIFRPLFWRFDILYIFGGSIYNMSCVDLAIISAE